MASTAPGGGGGGGMRGRRKQAKPQRKVDESVQGVDQLPPPQRRIQYDTVLTEVAATASSMSPETGRLSSEPAPADKEAAVPEEVVIGITYDGYDGAKDPEKTEKEDAAAGVGVKRERVPSLTNGLLKDQQHHQEQHQHLQQVKQEDFANEYFIKCPQCQKGYQTFQALKEHMQDAKCCMENGVELGATAPTPTTPTAPGGPHGCPQCTTTFATKDQLEKHELLHSPNAQVSCKICNKTFANVYRLQRHMISHDESAVLRKFKCTECEKAFKFKHHLKEHIRIHSGEKPFECGNCGKRFSHSGSYSSHMTSKKCLVMNLKLGRTRTQNPGLLMEKPLKRPRLNNNLSTSPNHNAYLPILPKFTEAAAAFLQNSGMSPFYIPNTNLMNPSGTHPINPYSLSHILEQFHTQTPQEPTTNNTEEETTKSNSSSCDLIMDEDIIERTSQTNEESKDFVKRILETVNSNVTKELLQANMQKFNSETSSDAQSVATPSPKAEFACCVCKLAFGSQMALDDHDCVEKSEGLAAKLEDVVKSSESCGEDDLDLEKSYEDSESVTTTDHVSEDGRKVRVRSLISDEQLKVLKDNYALNPRPKREELLKIANNIGFPVRVVQVWFQNTRARDRREGRIINIPYNFQSQKYLPITTLNQFSQSDEPLDLSTKKSPLLSTESSPSNSPRRINSDSEDLKASSHQQLSSPSPTDFNSSRLAQILAQPKLALPSSMMVPMDQLMQFGTADLSSLSQLISSRMNSPGAEKKYEDGEERKMRTQYVLKGLGSPVLVGQGDEPEGQFTCDQCDKAFSKQSSLARHKYEHSGQRPHKCNECPKAFKHKHHLTEHKRLHSGEKPFQCCKCLKRFSHSGSYSQHMNHRYSYCKPYRE